MTSAMDRFDLEGAGARVEVPRIRGPRMARGLGEPLPLWHYPKMRRPATAAKFSATVDEAIPASPVAADPVRGDPFACAVAKAMPTDRGARQRPGAEIGFFKRLGQRKDVAASLRGGACFDAPKGTRVRA